MKLLHLATALFLLLPMATAHAADEELSAIGQLDCSTSRQDVDDRSLEVSALTCDLSFNDSEGKSASVDGRLFGRGLYLERDPEMRMVWKVFAPQQITSPELMNGDYDIESRYNFPLLETNKNVLVGGERDTIALQLVEPQMDAIDPATRLTLDVATPDDIPYLDSDDQ